METQLRFAVKDADATHTEMLERGVDADVELTRMGEDVPPMFLFRDPDGNGYVIVQAD